VRNIQRRASGFTLREMVDRYLATLERPVEANTLGGSSPVRQANVELFFAITAVRAQKRTLVFRQRIITFG